jgi:protein-S-isoprenylcysteine O-methyltransferase Ste14
MADRYCHREYEQERNEKSRGHVVVYALGPCRLVCQHVFYDRLYGDRFFCPAGHHAITGGIYHYSRNPMYASFSLVMLGTAIAAQSLLLLGMWTVTAICTHVLITGEERYCLTTYGDSYRAYMKKTPRYFFFF